MRKKPSQQRSRQMVDVLVDATAKTIAERGLGDTTTNHIAACAGVSVGSLYQYFDGKDALVSALLDRISAELAQLVDRELTRLMDADPRTATRGLLTAVFDFMEQGDRAYLELMRHWQQLRVGRSFAAIERHMLEACRQYLLRHHSELRVQNLPAALFVVISGTLYTVMHYLNQQRPFLKREEVIDAMADMIAAYVKAVRPRSGVARRRR
jgi:AcrR family transcriptional regulator